MHVNGDASVWTDNRFVNKFAAMPSLHFGYALLIGLTIATIPLHTPSLPKGSLLPTSTFSKSSSISRRTPQSWRRLLCLSLGIFYPALILVVVVATANHFILDTVAGAMICCISWWGNDILLNLLVIEDWFLWVVRIHKPESQFTNLST